MSKGYAVCFPPSIFVHKVSTHVCSYLLFFTVKGLGIIPGIVGRFDSSEGLRVPHIGWNALQISGGSGILDDIGGRHVYFVHSYRAMPVCSMLFI